MWPSLNVSRPMEAGAASWNNVRMSVFVVGYALRAVTCVQARVTKRNGTYTAGTISKRFNTESDVPLRSL